MIRQFVDRKEELRILEREWRNTPSFIVLYGRRRVGKTRLLLEFSKGKNTFFYTFLEGTKENQISSLRRELAEFFGDQIFLSFTDWYPLFKYLSMKIKDKTLIVFDEFTYAIKSDRSILSALQRAWDHDFSRKETMLVLSGSLIGMMFDEVLSYASPLYGRRTAGFILRPLGFFDALRFFKDFEVGLKSYMTIGGVPAYLTITSKYQSFEEFITHEFLSQEGFFYDEPYIVLSQELRELRVYFSILASMALGKRRPSEIASFAGLEGRRIYPYLENLIRLGFVERELPVARKEKRGLYKIKDPMLFTWFSLVYRNRTAIETGTLTYSSVKEILQRVFSIRFEEISKEFLVELNKTGKLPFRFTKIGRWWHKGEKIDILALNEQEKKALFVEVKWKELSEREARGILKDLERKSELVSLKDWKSYYGLIVKKLREKEKVRDEGFLIWDLKDFEMISPLNP